MTASHLAGLAGAVLVGSLPRSPTAVVQPSWAKLFNRQLPLLMLWTFAPSMLIRDEVASFFAERRPPRGAGGISSTSSSWVRRS